MLSSKSPRRGHLPALVATLAVLAAAPALAQDAPAAPTQSVAPPAAAAPEAAAPVDPKAVVARVNGQEITQADVTIALADIGNSFTGMTDPQKREAVIGLLIDVKLVAGAAEQAGLGKDEAFERQMAFLRDKALMQAYLDQQGEKSVNEEEVKKVYNDTVKEITPETEVRARHILVESEDEAKAAAERLAKGEDFAAVAKELSKDPGSGENGGDLGFFTKEQMVPEFAEAAFAQKPGEVSKPVKSQFGWHIIKTEETRQTPVPTIDQVRDQIEVYLGRRAQQDAIQKLRSDAKIERVGAPAETPADGKAAPAEPAAPATPAP